MKYRPEIDGLRAIAVLPVILFHAGLKFFSGGYVGVDVFFVISGYLITTILLNEIEQGRFSIVKFYERRAKRILPALFVVLIACIPFAWAWLTPSQLASFGQGLIAIILFGSNILFWRQSDYFAAASEENPLLHTWSLAVEEQYYIFFPLLLLGLWRFGRNPVFYIVVTLSLLSLALAEWGWRYSPTANFYLLPTRAWELGAGAICAFVLQKREQPNNQFIAWLGLLMIIVSILSFDSRTPFPSLYALLPVVGTALLILFAGDKTFVGRLLSLRPLVGIGLLSYSAYLWHQPLFAFARIRAYSEPSLVLMLGLAAISLMLAYFTWQWVEQPFRKKSYILASSRNRIFGFAAAGSLLFFLAGSFIHYGNGFPERQAPSGHTFAALRVDKMLEHNFGLNQVCEETFTLNKLCRTGEQPEVLVWGDSYAMHLLPALIHSASLNGRSIIQHTKSNCAPILDLALTDHYYGEAWARECIAFNKKVFDWLSSASSIDYVLLSSPMHIIEKATVDSQGNVFPASQSPEQVRKQLNLTAQKISELGIKVVLIAPPPRTGENLANCVAHQLVYQTGDMTSCSFSTHEFMPQHTKVMAFLSDPANDVKAFDFASILCHEEECHTYIDGINIYRDQGHLSVEGSKLMGQKYNLFGLLNDLSP
ncbi:acyltransferase [Pseudidiomarina sp. 1APP75-32.1]|uniref:Acyltransferase n=1 Tax=Pseudidiomarina terrestris TaxID=2820060 RepID=A0AAW7R0A4_9GAMM|nr:MULTISPECIES: acyltransferase family protein [unclassified Pseudidiomarina]MDN7124548.1 acyltransferase [Pseudidiomarina sp. 1APP75-32.1]MDN7129161.1 acyltransferase [Pseudidiomarina sp. 1APR75-15]MEA3587637.1 acyltransferase [Pseudidiomarina sp. 1APP75-27a]